MIRHRFDDTNTLSPDVVRPEYDGSHVILSLKSGGAGRYRAAFSEIDREEEEKTEDSRSYVEERYDTTKYDNVDNDGFVELESRVEILSG